MKHLFLTSSVHAVAHHIAKKLDVSSRNKLVFITTPAEPETGDLTWLQNDRQSLVNAGWDVTDYTITGKNKDQLKTDLSVYDYIYMSGGNTLYLLKKSQETGFIDIIKNLVLKEGKVYIGTSAGSIITGPKCPDYYNEDSFSLKDRTGYGFVNFTLVPHWGSEDFRELYLGGRLEIAYKEDQVPLLLLTDYQYVHVQDNNMEVIDVRK